MSCDGWLDGSLTKFIPYLLDKSIISLIVSQFNPYQATAFLEDTLGIQQTDDVFVDARPDLVSALPAKCKCGGAFQQRAIICNTVQLIIEIL